MNDRGGLYVPFCLLARKRLPLATIKQCLQSKARCGKCASLSQPGGSIGPCSVRWPSKQSPPQPNLARRAVPQHLPYCVPSGTDGTHQTKFASACSWGAGHLILSVATGCHCPRLWPTPFCDCNCSRTCSTSGTRTPPPPKTRQLVWDMSSVSMRIRGLPEDDLLEFGSPT
jgi:hypothetical protein